MALVTLTPGETFAQDFTVGGLVAAGGMGAVYRAEQRSTGNPVALKIMLPELLADARSRERFEQEARVSARIRSSHVVRVLAAGVDAATQTPWLAMEFVEGANLAAVGASSPEVARTILAQVGHALAAAHAAGVVHCDLKPDNVMVAASRTAGVALDVKVLDFGIARLVQEGRPAATLTTAMGSPHWLAPEQGSAGRTVGPPTDVWSFGLLAFWLLTGRYYWAAANVPAAEFNVYSLLGEVAGKEPIAPASERLRALGEQRALLPAGFDGWFARCVDRDPARRFATGAEASAALDAVLNGASAGATMVGVPSVPPPERAVEKTVAVAAPTPANASAQQRRRNIAVAAAVTLALAVAAVKLTGSAEPAEPVATAAESSSADAAAAPPSPCPAGMVLIPAGRFQMGEGNPQGVRVGNRLGHPVRLSAFCIDRTEVTVAAYRRCVATGDCGFNPYLGGQNCNHLRTDREDHPINCVDWEHASTFCLAHGGSLPTEAQWEYAARGADGRTYPWGNEAPNATLLNINNGLDNWDETAPVGSFPAGASPFGLLDMAGNVWEWTADWYAPYPDTDVVAADPVGPEHGDERFVRGGTRAIRGGSFIQGTDQVGASYRLGQGVFSVQAIMGFRCAATPR